MSGNDKLGGGIGRAGRGAMLLAALKNQPRRPGEGRPDSLSEATGGDVSAALATEQPKALGRGALLKNLLQGRGRASPAAVAEDIVPGPPGRGASGIHSPASVSHVPPTLGRGRGIPRQRVETPSVTFEHEPEVPVAEMEELSIGKYSGTSGKPLSMEVNYVRLKTEEGQCICEYHVHFDPPVDSRNMKFKLISQPCVKEVIGQVKSFDGSKLYLPIKLMSSEVIVQACMPTDNSPISVNIKYVKVSKARELIHLYNLLFRKVMYVLKMTQVGRNYFDPKGGIPIPKHRLEIWPGYVTAVQEYEGGVMLNCDASFRVLRTVTAREMMAEAAARRDKMHSEVERVLIGAVVLTRYNNKTYKVDDISWDMTPNSTFTSHDGKEISFLDYYKRSYDITIKDLDQPLLISKPQRKVNEEKEKLVCLVPELCYMTGLTDAMRSDFRVMKDVASHTRVAPNKRQLCLLKFIENVNSFAEARKVLEDWNLQLDNCTLPLDGRVLDSEKIIMRKSSFITSREADWKRQIGQSEVLVPVNLENWIVVFTRKDTPKVQDFITMMKRVCPSLGIRVNDPSCCPILNDRTETFCNALKDNVNPRVQLVVVVFPTARDDRYNAVKKLCCVEMPVPSQVINLRTISQYDKLRSIAQNIALQINCKLGGELWSIAIPLDNIMVCGIDSYHDSVHKNKSVLAFISSINRNLTRWFSMTSAQQTGQEMGDALRILFLSALRKYHEVNHKLPEKIFIYRDGVGDGMLDFVAKHEVEQLIGCFKNMQQNYSPTLSFVVVQKRINTRIYHKTNGSLENPPPGSVLDHTVTRKSHYDFFLVSQHVRHGTVSPTHFIVVYDSSVLKPEHMQRLAYKTTHLYYNWPGTIRVPAPCLYAHKLAFLVGQSLHKEAHPALLDKLFYL